MLTARGELFRLYEECVNGHRQGTNCCGKFFELILPLIRRTAFRVARQYSSISETEDLVQEITLKLVERGPELVKSIPHSDSQTEAYLAVIAANTARDFFKSRNAVQRSASRTVTLDDKIGSVVGSTQDGVEQSVMLRRIEDCLPKDRRERAVFRLYYRQGFTARELAAIPALEMNIKGIESMIHRIALKIRKCLKLETGKHGEVEGKPGQESLNRE